MTELDILTLIALGMNFGKIIIIFLIIKMLRPRKIGHFSLRFGKFNVEASSEPEAKE